VRKFSRSGLATAFTVYALLGLVLIDPCPTLSCIVAASTYGVGLSQHSQTSLIHEIRWSVCEDTNVNQMVPYSTSSTKSLKRDVNDGKKFG